MLLYSHLLKPKHVTEVKGAGIYTCCAAMKQTLISTVASASTTFN